LAKFDRGVCLHPIEKEGRGDREDRHIETEMVHLSKFCLHVPKFGGEDITIALRMNHPFAAISPLEQNLIERTTLPGVPDKLVRYKVSMSVNSH
jgi:hypothetical protein